MGTPGALFSGARTGFGDSELDDATSPAFPLRDSIF
jgi:hypothetical protein